MGHLVNPVGFRVGYYSSWLDIWVAPNNIIYAELLHNTVSFRHAANFFFENFVTDKYSILYSHATVENASLASLKLKLYFYDGIVEQKMEHLLQHVDRVRRKHFKAHRRVMRRFRKVKFVKSFRAKFLRLWRYYDYLLARRTIFFFIYFLNMGRRNMSQNAKINVVRFYYQVFSKEWSYLIRMYPNMSVFAFLKYYVKLLSLYGFRKNKNVRALKRFYCRGNSSNFSIFFKIFDRISFFWRKRHNFFSYSVFYQKVTMKRKYINFLKNLENINLFSRLFFSAFYRAYLLNFRQSKFFKFMSYIVDPVLSSISSVPIKVEFFGIDNNTVSAYFLAKYLARKIEMRFKLKELFTPLGREMRFLIRNTSFLLGYKFQFVGRLTRRGRVRTQWALGGKIPTSKLTAQIEHSLYLGILRNGLSCIRVWLYRHKSFGNFNQNFKYHLKV